MKNVLSYFLSPIDVPVGLTNVNQGKIITLRLFDLKSDTPPKYSIYYQDSLIK